MRTTSDPFPSVPPSLLLLTAPPAACAFVELVTAEPLQSMLPTSCNPADSAPDSMPGPTATSRPILAPQPMGPEATFLALHVLSPPNQDPLRSDYASSVQPAPAPAAVNPTPVCGPAQTTPILHASSSPRDQVHHAEDVAHIQCLSGDANVPTAMQVLAPTSNSQASCPIPLHVLGYIDSLRAYMDLVLPTPSTRHKRDELPPNFTPRRSGRIAKNDRGLDSEAKAKRVLLRRLGIIEEDEPISNAILECYTHLFDRPLAVEVVYAFADFYGWRIPPELFDCIAPTQPRLVEI